MADPSPARRILYMHPAHRTVGVSGVGPSFRPCRPVERPEADEPAVAPMRVALVSQAADRRSRAAMVAFERMLLAAGNMQCERRDLAAVAAEGLADADCAVVFGRGLQIVGHWPAFDADAVAECGFEEDDGFETEVEVAAAARWHPVVDGVGPFLVRNRCSESPHLSADATHLLVRKWAGRVFPVAWARQDDGRAFGTLLGHPKDFRHPEFVRLLQNAIEWIGR